LLVGVKQIGPDGQYDCERCNGLKQCWFKESILTCRGTDETTETVTVDEWEKVVDKAKSLDSDISEYVAFVRYRICPIPCITPLSVELFTLFAVCNGFSVRAPAEYYALPAIYADAVNIIKRELDRLERIKNDGE